MAIINCVNNHFYDDEKYDACPFCNSVDDTEEGMTLAKFDEFNSTDFFENFGDDSATMAFFDEVAEEDVTIGILHLETTSNPVAGWLVCTSGSVKGKSYELHLGRNYIGRDKKMDIVLTDDNSISRSRHFSIVYDPKSNGFYSVPDEGFVYINDNLIKEPTRLNDGDEIHVGNTVYVFVAYCNENRRWL